MITIFVKYTVNLHPICLRICFRKRQNCSPRASKMEQFSGGGPPNPCFLPKLSMTVQVNHKKLYYNYYTLGKYLLKIQISGKILSKNYFKNGRKKTNFEPYPKHAVAMVTDFQHKSRALQCSGQHCQCVQYISSSCYVK